MIAVMMNLMDGKSGIGKAMQRGQLSWSYNMIYKAFDQMLKGEFQGIHTELCMIQF